MGHINVDWYAFFNLSKYRGEQATVLVNKGSEEGFDAIRMSAEIPAASAHYDEPLRPQLHFSQLIGWINDGAVVISQARKNETWWIK